MIMKNYTKLKYDGFESYLKIEEILFDGWQLHIKESEIEEASTKKTNSK